MPTSIKKTRPQNSDECTPMKITNSSNEDYNGIKEVKIRDEYSPEKDNGMATPLDSYEGYENGNSDYKLRPKKNS